MKKILLITYAFPPNTSIGARRWAKLCKYLAKDNIIHVITAKSYYSKGSNWVEDILHENIKVHYIDDKQTKWLREGYVKKSDYLKRFIRKIYITYLEFIIGGLWMDEARFMKKNTINTAIKLINEHGIKNVISTGPPNNLNYYTALLRKYFPALNIICDFRDSWTDAKNYAYEKIPKYVVKTEEKKQRYVCENATKLTFTYSAMQHELMGLYPHIAKEKFIHLPHGYDPDDYPVTNQHTFSTINIVYGGAIYMDVFYSTGKTLLKSLNQLRQDKPDLYKKIRIRFYAGNMHFEKMVYNNDLNDIISFHQRIPEKDFLLECSKADYLLSILGENWKNYITSKTISQLGFNKAIIMVSNEGLASEFIQNNNFGYILNENNYVNFWAKLITEPQFHNPNVEVAERYKFEYLANQVNKMLIQ